MSVRLSVRHTLVLHQNKDSTPSSLFLHQRKAPRFLQCQVHYEIRKWSPRAIGPRMLLITNRSHIQAFNLHKNQRPWMAIVRSYITHIFRSTPQKFEWTQTHTISDKIVAIFACFVSYIFWTVTNKATITLSGFQWHQNRWPWMTPNCHFALSLLRSACHGFTCSGFGSWDKTVLFRNLQSYAYTISGKNTAQMTVSGDTNFVQLFTGVPWRQSVKQENCIYGSHICCSLRSIK